MISAQSVFASCLILDSVQFANIHFVLLVLINFTQWNVPCADQMRLSKRIELWKTYYLLHLFKLLATVVFQKRWTMEHLYLTCKKIVQKSFVTVLGNAIHHFKEVKHLNIFILVLNLSLLAQIAQLTWNLIKLVLIHVLFLSTRKFQTYNLGWSLFPINVLVL